MPVSARPASLACLECRKVHLKCDGVRPACARCVSRGSLCNYTTSRRGRRRVRQPVNGLAEAIDTPPTLLHLCPSSQWTPDPSLEIHQIRADINSVDIVDNATRPESSLLPPESSDLDTQQTEPTQQWVDDVWLVNLYYLNFHPNHPILVPKTLYWKRGYPWYLKAVVEFIGSHFSQATSTRTLQEDVAKKLEEEEEEHDTPAVVQARILYTTILLGRRESQLCQRVLAHAVDAATRLGLYRRGFAMSHADGQPEEEESLRRTWYELYVLDGCVAASQRSTSFKTYTVDADVLLPCENKDYDNGMAMSTSYSRNDFENSAFIDEEVVFSSFCYRIEAVRLLGRVLTITGKHAVQRERVQAIDNALAAFLHNLPPSKRETGIVKASGDIDELMFQTHTIIQYATILLHFPRGDLVPLGPLATEIPGDSTTKFVCPCTRQQVHSVKAIDASKGISMLATFRIPIQRHTPLFIYPLVLSAMVQLSSCISHTNKPEHLEHHRDCVKLILGVLKSMGQYWSIAQPLLRALKRRALGVFGDAQNGESDSTQQQNFLVNGTFPLSHANRREVGSEDMMQPSFDELIEFDEFISFDNSHFCF